MSGDRNFRARWSRPPCGRIEEENCADVFAISTHGPREGPGQNEVARIDGLPGKARRVHSRIYADAEETELRAAQSRGRAVDELGRGDHVHSRHWPQLARAPHCARSRPPPEGAAWRSVSARPPHIC